MLEMMRSKLKRKVPPLAGVASLRRFVRRKDGAAAVEFALVLLPFLALMLGTMETALVFFADQTLQTMVSTGARLIMTGQAYNNGWQAADFKNAVCPAGQSYGGMIKCDDLYVNVQTFSSFGSMSYTPPGTSAQNPNLIDTSGFGYNPGSSGSIVLVQFFYQWPITVTLMGLNTLANGPGGTRLLVATAAFRNEPF